MQAAGFEAVESTTMEGKKVIPKQRPESVFRTISHLQKLTRQRPSHVVEEKRQICEGYKNQFVVTSRNLIH